MQRSPTQVAVLTRLAALGDPPRIPELAAALGLDQSPVTAACTELAAAGLVRMTETAYEEYTLGKDALPYASAPLPERVIVGVLAAQGGRVRITEIPKYCELNAGQVGQSLRWLAQRGWARKDGDYLEITDTGRSEATRKTADEEQIASLARRPHGSAVRGEEFLPGTLESLSKRKGFLSVKQRTERRVAITDEGRRLVAAGLTARRTVTQLTPELLSDGAWQHVDLQPYDVTLSAKRIFAGKEHPFQRTLEKVRRVFLEMGFTEVASPWVESSFWDFDALFQPQDHPARDMQDTFYVSRPDRCRLPDEALVNRVQAVHESGGETGSTGWRYRWSRDLAHKPVLRTHTTAATIRALAAHRPGTPGKYFVVGPVFRRETVDYKHLPVFHQVDGIIVDPRASLSSLVGTLSAFYGKMGFPKVRFRPSFFPYTEPSAEAYLWFERRQEWVEMGGSGIFRPEVTQPLGIADRVLAWGLGLERLAMLTHELTSITELYYPHMPWLREAPLCRA